MAVWVVRGGSGGMHEQRMLEHSFVSIGWLDMPDLSKVKTRAQLEKVYTAGTGLGSDLETRN